MTPEANSTILLVIEAEISIAVLAAVKAEREACAELCKKASVGPASEGTCMADDLAIAIMDRK